MDVLVTEEVIARQSPDAQSTIRPLLAVIQRQQATIDALTATVSTLTAWVKVLEDALDPKPKSPLNSSVPPSTEDPHAESLPPRTSSSNKSRGASLDTPNKNARSCRLMHVLM